MKTRMNKKLFLKAVIKNFFFILKNGTKPAVNTHPETEHKAETDWEKEYIEFYRRGTRWQTN
ncbi:MAG: hypothetical protein JW801_18990 [Bacteroidales bacterium]|nr:hypothetical protein [Bacteroidales bacterium]